MAAARGTGISAGRDRTMNLGIRVYGAGVMALGLVCLASQDFILSQGLPDSFPHRTALALLGAAFMLPAGAALEWRHTVSAAAAALIAFYLFVVLMSVDIPFILANYNVYGTYSNVAEELAIAGAAVIIFATSTPLDPKLARRLIRFGRVTVGICAVLFGGAHFFYLNLTTPLVPKYLPPSQLFWAYATGVAHIAAGIAIITGVQARLAAILLTIMYACFTPLVHLPLLYEAPANHFYWTENAVNLALTGAAWVVAESLRSAR